MIVSDDDEGKNKHIPNTHTQKYKKNEWINGWTNEWKNEWLDR